MNQRDGEYTHSNNDISSNNDTNATKTRAQRRSEIRAMFKSNVNNRLKVDRIMIGSITACAIIAIVPLFWILGQLIVGGVPALTIDFLTEEPGAIGAGTINIGPAIQGTIIIIGLSSVIGIPIGIGAGIYLSEVGTKGRLTKQIRFWLDVFMQVPSIVLGLFAFLAIVLLLGHFSIWAGAFALSLIMFPIVARATEEQLKLVPWTYREAGTALGLKKTTIAIKIVLASAKQGLLTGILLSISRIGGETAPLIMTILGSSQFFSSLDAPMDALPLRIWRFSLLPYEEARLAGWGAALVLVIIILAIHVGVRYYFQGKRRNGKSNTKTTSQQQQPPPYTEHSSSPSSASASSQLTSSLSPSASSSSSKGLLAQKEGGGVTN